MFDQHTRFLVVDDTKTIRSMIKESLEKMGYYRIEGCDNGKTALEKLKDAHENNEPYGFIFCDWNMPVMTGLELLDIRNNDPRFKNIPFMMVTIESEREYVLKAVSMGVSDFIVKPFSGATIAAKMKSIWDRIQQQAS